MTHAHPSVNSRIARVTVAAAAALTATALAIPAGAATAPSATITALSATYGSSHGAVVVNGTADVQNAPSGSNVSVQLTVSAAPGASIPTVPGSPVVAGTFGSSFPVTPTPTPQYFVVAAQVTVDGHAVGAPDSTAVTVPSTGGGGAGGTNAKWEQPTLTATPKC